MLPIWEQLLVEIAPKQLALCVISFAYFFFSFVNSKVIKVKMTDYQPC